MTRIGRPILLLATLAAPAAAGAQYRSMSLGANNIGYVSSNLLFTAGCASSNFTGSPRPRPRLWNAGNATFRTGAGGCAAGTDWSGTSVMQVGARVLRSSTSVAAAPGGHAGREIDGRAHNGLVALSRAAFLDEMTVDGAGAVPDSVRFRFTLDGVTARAPGANTYASNTFEFGMGWDTAPSTVGMDQRKLMPAGDYVFTFAFTPGMVGRAVPFSTEMFNLAVLRAVDPALPLFGSNATDFGSTLTMTRVQFLRATGAGAGADISASVRYASATGTDYLAPLAVVPEPATLALALAGLLALGAGARVTRRAAGTPAPR